MRLFIQDECLYDRFSLALTQGSPTYHVSVLKVCRVFRFHRELWWYVVDLKKLPSAIEVYNHNGETVRTIPLSGKETVVEAPLRVERSLDPGWRPHRIDFAVYDRHLVRSHSFGDIPVNVSAYDWSLPFLAGPSNLPVPFFKVADSALQRGEDPLSMEGFEALFKAYVYSNGRIIFSFEEFAQGVDASVYLFLRSLDPSKQPPWAGSYLAEERRARLTALKELLALPRKSFRVTRST